MIDKGYSQIHNVSDKCRCLLLLKVAAISCEERPCVLWTRDLLPMELSNNDWDVAADSLEVCPNG